MDSDILRWVAGIIGGLLTMMMFASPVNTLRIMIKNKSSSDISALPYAIAMLYCLVYVFYSTPFVSKGWSNLLVFILNSSGLVLIIVFVSIFLLYAPPASKGRMRRLLVGVVIFFVILLLVSIFCIGNIKHRRLVVGTAGMIVGIILNASPFSALVQVVRTKSVEFMPISFSIFSTLCCSVWLAYGFLGKDVSIMASNAVGIILGVIQIIVYLVYCRNATDLKNNSNEDQFVKVEIVIPIETPQVTMEKDTTPSSSSSPL